VLSPRRHVGSGSKTRNPSLRSHVSIRRLRTLAGKGGPLVRLDCLPAENSMPVRRKGGPASLAIRFAPVRSRSSTFPGYPAIPKVSERSQGP